MTKDFIDQFIFKNIRFKIKLINNSRNIKLFNSLGLNNTKLLEKGSFLKIINNYDLIIFNYYSTGFLECLSLNKPALVINNESKKTFNYKFINDLKLLQIHGLYFNNINSFNEKFNYDIQSFISYWHYPKTQIIINKFKKKYSNYENDRKILYRLII